MLFETTLKTIFTMMPSLFSVMKIRSLYKVFMWFVLCTLFTFAVIRLTRPPRFDTALRWNPPTQQTLDINKTLHLNVTAMTNASRYARAMTLVSICPARLRGDHRAGNQIFILASMLHVAKVTGRTFVMPRKGWYLDRMFEIDVPRFDDYEKQICPCSWLGLWHYAYYKPFDDPNYISSLSKTQGSILPCGLSQTFRYAIQNEEELRRMLKFPVKVSAFAENFLIGIGGQNEIKIAVHVRRGDFLHAGHNGFGLTTADKQYFEKAFKYFTDKYNPVHFVIATEDRNWTIANLPSPSSRGFVTFTGVNNTAAQDLAILSKCDGVIMSTGSFGWWAAWLANKTTIYYSEYPRKGSAFYYQMDKKNYFPPEWIGM